MGYILNYSNWRRIFEAEEEKQVSIVFASTSIEKMPNSTNVKNNGLVTPTDTTTYPDIEKTVFSAKVSDWLKGQKGTSEGAANTLLSAFKPVRTTSTGMDVLKVGSLGGDYTQGGVTPSGGIQFMSNSTDVIEASHNGLLVLARALETWIDAGKPAGVKFMLKMGQAKRMGSFIDLGNLSKLDHSLGTWESYMAASLIPDGMFADNTWKETFDGKTAEERATELSTFFSNGWATSVIKLMFPFTTTTAPAGVDYSKWITNYFGKVTQLGEYDTVSGLQKDYETMFIACRDHYVKEMKSMYANLLKIIGGTSIPEIDEKITSISAKTATRIIRKANPIMTKASGSGSGSSSTTKAVTSQYELGQAKN
jgi:hypothetical protein